MSIRPLLKQEIPWLISELVLLIVLLNANPPELWFWFVVFWWSLHIESSVGGLQRLTD
jgi:hypothetical protein